MSATRSDATSAAIMDAAERLFREIGYRKTAVADIARALGMSPANVYRFFPSKAAINEAICDRLLSGLRDRVWAVARARAPAPDRLRGLFALLQEQTMTLFFREKKMHDMVAVALEEHWSTIEHHVQDLDAAFRHVIMDGQAEGCFARTDADQAARLVHSMTVQFSHPMVAAQCAGDDLHGLAAGMADFALRALRPHPDD